MNADIAEWFCCLHPRERGVLSSVFSAQGVAIWFGIPLGAFNAFWLLYTPRGQALRSAFVEVFGLEIVTIETDVGEQQIVRSRSDWIPYHVQWYAFLLTSESACGGGCAFTYVE